MKCEQFPKYSQNFREPVSHIPFLEHSVYNMYLSTIIFLTL